MSSRRSAYRRIVVLAACALLFVGCDNGTAPEPEPPPAALVFVSDRAAETGERGDTLEDLYLIAGDGTVLARLTDVPTRRWRELHLSPDGRTIAGVAFPGGCEHIWAVPLNGDQPERLTNDGDRCNRSPKWSPDGSQIAFTSSRDGYYTVYVMGSDGANPVDVSQNTSGDDGYDWVQGWTPDGRIVYEVVATRAGADPNGIMTYAVRTDGTDRQPVLPALNDLDPYWSPDGSRIAFIRMVEPDFEQGYDIQLFLMNADGTEERQITAGPGNRSLQSRSVGQVWSPDGSRIVFHHWLDTGIQLFVADVNAGAVVQITNEPEGASFNGWSPDGTRIAYTAGSDGDRDVFLVNPDGSGRRNLTDRPGDDHSAVWLRSPGSD